MIRKLRRYFAGDGLKAQLLRSGSGSVVVQVLSSFLALVFGIVLARSLGVAGYGVYAYAFAIMSLLMVAADAGVPTLLMREVASSLGRGDWGLLKGALVRGGQFVALASTSVSVCGLLVLWWFAEELSSQVLKTTGLMLLVLPVAALVRTISHVMLGLHHPVTGRAVDAVFRPMLVLLFVAGLFFARPDMREPQFAMAAQLVAALIVSLVGLWVLCRFVPEETRNVTATYRSQTWLQSAVPFALIGGAGIINNQADMIMLGWFSSAEDVGVYRVAVQGASLVAFSLQAANSVVAPQFARLHAKGDMVRLQRLVTISARLILLAALPVALVFVLAGDAIVSWVFGPEFISSYSPLAILAVGQLINAAMGSVGFLLSMTGHESDNARTLWQTAVLNILMNTILIPLYGIVGAAVASATSLVVWNILLLRLVRQHLGLNSTAFASVRLA